MKKIIFLLLSSISSFAQLGLIGSTPTTPTNSSTFNLTFDVTSSGLRVRRSNGTDTWLYTTPRYSGTGYLKLSGTTASYVSSIPQSDVASLTTDLGNKFSTTGGNLVGTAGSGFVGYISQSTAPSTPASGFRLYANSSGLFSWKGTNGFQRIFDGASSTADRTYTLPDASGTFGLLGSTQSWTGTNTFTGNTYLATSSGNVGIGTTAGGYKLRVNGSTYIENGSLLIGNNNFINWLDSGGNSRRIAGVSSGNIAYFGDVDNIITSSMTLFAAKEQHRFFLNGTERLTITQNGSIGVGITTPTSTLHNVGSEANAITTISTATTLANNYYIIADGGSTYLVTLPSASTCTGRTYVIKTITANKTISSFLNLSGSSTTTLTAGTVIYVVSDGTNWQQF